MSWLIESCIHAIFLVNFDAGETCQVFGFLEVNNVLVQFYEYSLQGR